MLRLIHICCDSKTTLKISDNLVTKKSLHHSEINKWDRAHIPITSPITTTLQFSSQNKEKRLTGCNHPSQLDQQKLNG